MFITLRSSGGQAEARGGKELEQVARRNAGPGVDRVVKDRVRAARRPACVACQTKKVCRFIILGDFIPVISRLGLQQSNHSLARGSSGAPVIAPTAVIGAELD